MAETNEVVGPGAEEVLNAQETAEDSRETVIEEAKETAKDTEKESELIRGYRIFPLDGYKDKFLDNVKQTEIHIYHPKIGEDSEIDNFHSRTLSKLMKEGDLFTEEEMAESLNKRGIWTEAQIKELDKIVERIARISSKIISAKIEGTMNSPAVAKWKEERTELNQKRNKLDGLRSKYMNSTVEANATREQAKKKMQLCCRYASGARVWNSLEDLNGESDVQLVFKLLYQCMYYWSGIDQSFLGDFLEEAIGEYGTI